MSVNLAFATLFSAEGIIAEAGSDTVYERTIFPLDTTDYDGTATYRFQIRAYNTDTVSRSAYIVDSGGTTKATIAVPAGTGAAGSYKFFQTTWTPTSGAERYRLKLEGTTSAAQFAVSCPTWGLKLVNATKAKLYFLIDGEEADKTGDGSLAATSNTAYVAPNSNVTGYFRYTASDWDATTKTFGLEVVGKKSSTNTARHSKYSLFRVSDDAQVTASEVTTPSDSDTSIRWLGNSGDVSGDANFTDGSDYRVKIRSTNLLNTVSEYNCWVTVTLTGITACKTWLPLGQGLTVQVSTDTARCRAAYEPSDYTNPTVYLELSGKQSVSDSNGINLSDRGSSDGPGGTGTSTTPAASVTGTSQAWYQAGPVTVTGSRFGIKGGGTGNTSEDVFAMMAVYVASSPVDALSPQDSLSPRETVAAQFVGYQWTSPEDSVSPREEISAELTSYEQHSPEDSISPRESPIVHLYDYQWHSPEDSISPRESVAAASQLAFGPKMLVIAEVALSAGTKYVSNVDAAHPTRLYRGRVKRWGRVDRSIPVVPGLPHVGDGRVEIADTDLEWAKSVGDATPVGAEIKIKWGPEGGRESIFPVVYTGTVTNVSTQPGLVRLSFRDKTWAFLDDEIPALATSENFTLFMDKGGGFAPIVLGTKDSSGLTDAGAVNCPRVSATEWIAARHPVFSVDRVYKKSSSENEWTLLSSAVWTSSETVKTINCVSYTFTVINTTDFEDGTEIRCDIQGAKDSDGVLISNPADATQWLLLNFAGRTQAQFDQAAWDDLSTALTALGWTISFAIVGDPDWRAVLARISSSFNIDFRTDDYGKIWAGRTLELDASRPVLDDTLDLMSLEQESPNPINAWEYAYNAIGEGLYSVETFRDEDSIAAIGERKDIINLWAVDDADTAYSVVAEKALLTSQDSFKAKFKVSAPRLHYAIKLSNQVGLTSFYGLDSSGALSNEPHRITSVSLDLDDLSFEVEAVKLSSIENAYALLSGTWAFNAIPGPWRGPGAGILFGVFRAGGGTPNNQSLKIYRSADWGATWTAETKSTGAQISSYDSYASGNTLHIAVQHATTANVTYWQYNMATRTWAVENESVATPAEAPKSVNHAVSICAVGSDVWLMYAVGETLAGVLHGRAKARKRSGGSWSGEYDISPLDATGSFVERVVPGAGSRAHFFYRDIPGSVRSAGNSMHRTWDGSAMGAQTAWINQVLGFNPSTHNMGRYCVYTHEDGTTRLIVPFKGWVGHPYSMEFTSADDLPGVEDADDILDEIERIDDGTVYQSEAAVGGFTRAPSISIGRLIDSTGSLSARAVFASVNKKREVYKSGGPGTWIPPDLGEDASGPALSGVEPQSSSALFVRTRGRIYIASFFSIGSNIGFQLVSEADIPQGDDYDQAAFLALAGSVQ